LAVRIRLNHKRFLELLAGSKLSQNHWAIRLGLSRGHWSGIVNGKHPYPSKKTRDLLLEALGVPFEELFAHESRSGVEADLQAALADRYLLEKELGQGGMGTVFVARDVKLGRLVAIKVVSPEAVSGIGVDRFLKEIRYAARLEHPHILPLYDSSQAAGHPYYVMPCIRGGSLRDRLNREKRLTVAGALSVARGVSAALTHAHERQVVHCDVKPENILLADDHAYLADFGISRAIHSEVFEWGRRREIDASAGTPAYVSPEQATGEQHLDAKSDVYSLGCVVFEMLSGEKPFEGTTTMEIVSRRLRETVPDLRMRAPHIPRAMCAAVAGAMALDRDQRTETAKAFVAALERGSRRGMSPLLDAGWRVASKVWSLGRRVIGIGKKTRLGASVEAIWQDIRYSARRMRKAPGFTLAAVLILAVGIGGNAAIFSVLKQAILADPPYPEPERLVLPSISHAYPTYWYHGASYPEFEMLRDLPDRLVDPLAGYTVEPVTLSGVGDPERIAAEVVTPDYFRLLGVSATVGRTFSPDEGDATSPPTVVVIGDGLWSGRFGRDPGVLGREIYVNGNAVTIVGIMPRGFRGVTGRGRLWLPMAAAGVLMDAWRISNHGVHWFSMLGRLRPGVSVETAEAQLLPVAQEIRLRWPNHGSGGDLVPVARPFRAVATNEGAKTSLMLLSAAAALMLLIVCANLAGLLLARTSARTREMAIRLAIGAGRWRVARQCLTECLLVGVMGGVAGLALAGWGADGLTLLSPESRIAGSNNLQFVDLEQISIDGGVVLFAVGLSVVTSLLFGLLPAFSLSRPRQLEELRAPLGATTGGRGARRGVDMRSVLVSGQVALTLILLIGAGLMMFSMAELQSVETGIEEDNLLTFSYTLPRSAESTNPHLTLSDADAEAMMAFHESFLARLKSVPGVVGATTGCPPLGGLCATSQVRAIEGRPEIPESERLQVGTIIVEESYFETVGAEWLEGRMFTSADWHEAQQVLILNESAARALFRDEAALGQRLSLGHSVMPEGATAEVVGVVSDILYASPDVGPQSVVYLSSLQVPSVDPTFIVRTANDPFSILPAIRAELHNLNATVPIHRVSTVETLGAQARGSTRLVMRVLSIFATFATILAVLGIYAAIAYAVSLRQREIGIRVALGARSNEVEMLVLRQGAAAAGVGVLVGLGAAWGITRLLSSLLFEVSAADPVTYGLAATLLFAATLLATYLPARRVTRIDPVQVLRTE
jgi:predicted permease